MDCPKCQRPLDEGDESYICCAGETLRWRCGQCAKVSEGFAFPYGRCPLCGGPLEALGERSLDETGAVEAVRTAFEIELGGQAFYARAATEVDDPALADLFGRMAAMESEHIAVLARRYHTAPPAPPPFLPLDPAASGPGADGRPLDPPGLFRMAIAFEERAVAFFTARAERAGISAVERQLYRELAAEEREHAALLGTEFGRWAQGKPGIL